VAAWQFEADMGKDNEWKIPAALREAPASALSGGGSGGCQEMYLKGLFNIH